MSDWQCEACLGPVDDRQPYCGTCGAALDPPRVGEALLGPDQHPDNRDDGTMMLGEQTDPRVRPLATAPSGYESLPPEHDLGADPGDGRYDAAAYDGPYADDPLPPLQPRSDRRPWILVAAVSIAAIALVVAVLVVVLRDPPGRTTTAGQPSVTPTRSSTDPTAGSEGDGGPTDPGPPALPGGADANGWTDSPKVRCTAGAAVMLVATATFQVTVCRDDGGNLTYLGRAPASDNGIELPASYGANGFTATNLDTTYTVGPTGLQVRTNGELSKNETVDVIWFAPPADPARQTLCNQLAASTTTKLAGDPTIGTSEGPAVTVLTDALQQLGVLVGGPTDTYTQDVIAVVKQFQASTDLEADGIVGPVTWRVVQFQACAVA